jgi:hypothetical protein
MTAQPIFSDAAFEVLRAAVTLARTGSYQRLEHLVRELHKRFPGQTADVDAAVAAWKRNPPSL